MNTITINGHTYHVSGNNISVINNDVIVNGVKINTGEKLKDIVTIKFDGCLATLHSDVSVDVLGDVRGNVTAGGSVKCEKVGGDVSAGGSVRCSQIDGRVVAGGSVHMNH